MTGRGVEPSRLDPSGGSTVGSRWIAVSLAGLVGWNVLAHLLPGTARLPLASLGVAALLFVARRAGLGWSQLGLGRWHLRRGARLGAASAVVVVVAVLLLAAYSGTRAILADGRFVGMETPQMAYEVAVRIPLAVAVAEEIAFRGVLLGMLDTRTTRVRAIWLSSAVFGLWHVLPALAALETASTLGGDPSMAVQIGLVAGQVVVTSLAGAVLAWLRLSANHVIAPILAHGALNSAAFLAGWLVVQNGWA